MIIPRFCLHMQKQLGAMMDHYKVRCEKETPVEERENLLKRLQDSMLNSDTATGKLFSEINDLHDKLLKLQDTVGGINTSFQQDRLQIREGGKLNAARFVIEDETELKKVKKESSWF